MHHKKGEIKEEKQLIVILAVCFLVSAFFGYGSTTMSGHETIIYPMLEGLFLFVYGVALIILAGNKKNKKETRILLLTTLVALLGG